MLKLIFVTLFVLALSSTQKSFRNEKVIGFTVATEEQLAVLKTFEDAQKIDIWNDHSDGKFEISIPQIHFVEFQTKFLTKFNIAYFVIISDLQEKIDEEMLSMAKAAPYTSGADDEVFFSTFRKIEEINVWLASKIAAFPAIASAITIGKSFEKRDIKGIKIHGKKSPAPNTKSLFFHGAIHAREWIAPTTVMWIANELLTKYQVDPIVKRLVDNIEFHVFPVANVDGYSFTHTTNRMWRKTRTANPGSTCMGTDPNRNFSFKWRSGGSSDSPCSETYHGSKAFSEVESLQIAEYGKKLPNLVGYIDYHAYGQLVMRPWGWTRTLAPDEAKLKKIGDETAKVISQLRGKTYRSGPFSTILYVGSGTTVDYFYDLKKVNAYCIELGTSFVMPVSEIKPIGQENFNGFKKFAELLMN
jgi:hypothetical protein